MGLSISKILTSLKERPPNPVSGAYDYSYWSKAFKSQRNEFDYTVSEVDGSIPASLQGSLFRAMPALFERGGRPYGHYLDGDGYITRLTFPGSGKSPRFQSAFVKTPEFLMEQAQDKVLTRSTFRTQREANVIGDKLCLNNALDLKLKNPANTNVISWGGKLLALFEAGVPTELDPSSLETKGNFDMNIGARSGLAVRIPELYQFSSALHDVFFGGTFVTAHPKVDVFRQRLIAWTSRAQVDPSRDLLKSNPLLEIHEWDTSFQLIPESPTQYLLENTATACHDFSVTENFYIFVENRMGGDTLPYVLGTKNAAECINIDTSKEMLFHAVARPGGKAAGTKPIVIPLQPGFTIHSPCAFENEKGQLELYTTAWDSQAVQAGEAKGGLLGSWEGTAPHFDDIPVTLLYKTVVDLNRGVLISHAPVPGQADVIVEHPHINPNYETKPVRFLHMSVGSTTKASSPPLGYQRVDLETGEVQRWYAPEHTYCEEVVVVPKAGASGSAQAQGEDAVWLLATMYDAVLDRSCIGVIDGEKVGRGPVARIWLSHHLPHSLHGCFTSP